MSLCRAANFIRSRVLIDLIRSGQRTVEVTVATPYFRALQPGDRVNFTQRHKVGSYSELVCEIVERQHFHTVGELLKAVGVERVVGAGKQRRRDRRDRDDDESAEAGVILQDNLSALDAVSEFGVLAFHLKVVEDE
jgi:ASC-1-like (ASCH) protein